METILGRQQLFHSANIAAKLEEEEENIKKVGTILKTLIDQLFSSSSLGQSKRILGVYI